MIHIAIDGPSGAGKSSVAKALAKDLSIIYVDTGALYRAIGYCAYINGIDKSETRKIIDMLEKVNLELKYFDGIQNVYLNGENLGDKIRLPEISMYASAVSAIPEVRAFLLETQRAIARENSVVMDGRDIGTVIMPDAEVKIFLVASDKERALRRYKELLEKGKTVTFDEVYNDMVLRDRNDSTRSIAPAIPAADAVLLDNTGMTVEQSVAKVKEIIRNKIGE